MEENLNLNVHIKTLIIKALNSSEDKKTAAKKLGIVEKTLIANIDKYGIEFKSAVWELKKQK